MSGWDDSLQSPHTLVRNQAKAAQAVCRIFLTWSFLLRSVCAQLGEAFEIFEPVLVNLRLGCEVS